jgi:hypothetical protein
VYRRYGWRSGRGEKRYARANAVDETEARVRRWRVAAEERASSARAAVEADGRVSSAGMVREERE